MNTKILLTILLNIHVFSAIACLNTYQFKTFPIGITGDTIHTVDVQIRRTSQAEGNRRLDLKLDSVKEWSEMWILHTYISKYDTEQNLLSKESLGVTYSIGKNYLDTLQATYLKGYNTVVHRYSSIRLLKPEYLSFCDFQHECELIKLENDSLLNKNYLIYRSIKYPMDIIQDTTYYAFNKSVYLPYNIMGLYANSIRIFKAGNFELAVVHLATGHEVGMGWITSDLEVYEEMKKKDEPISLAKEYFPTIEFKDITRTVYEEPLLHHGYGIDFFVAIK